MLYRWKGLSLLPDLRLADQGTSGVVRSQVHIKRQKLISAIEKKKKLTRENKKTAGANGSNNA